MGLGPRWGWGPGVALGYYSLSTLIFATVPVQTAWDIRVQTALHHSAMTSLLILVLVPAFCLARSSRGGYQFFENTLFAPFLFVALIQTVGIYLSKEPRFEVPLLINPSLAGTLIAIVALGSPWPVLLFVFPALVRVHAVTPFLCLFVGGIVRSPGGRKLALLTGLSLALVTLAIGYPKLEDGTGRFEVWQIVSQWQGLEPWVYRLFGNGLGSTPLIVPLLQALHGYDPLSSEFFMYLHNDWMQIILETGMVGGFFAGCVFVQTIGKAQGRPEWRAMVLAYGAAMLTSFPLHSPLLCFLGIVILGGAWLE